METLYCVNVSLVGYEEDCPTGHVILTITEPQSVREAETIEIKVPRICGHDNVRLWAKRALALALAEL